jgi:hypothetical protein
MMLGLPPSAYPPAILFSRPGLQVPSSYPFPNAWPPATLQLKAVNRGGKRSRRYRYRDFAKFERSRRYRDRYRCQEKKSRRGRDRHLVFRDPPRRERELDR